VVDSGREKGRFMPAFGRIMESDENVCSSRFWAAPLSILGRANRPDDDTADRRAR
jgi:hypothetical protein